MKCKHCYNASGMEFPIHDQEKLMQIADKICQENITDINFGTGEFLVNPNALFVAKYVKKNYPKVSLGLTTNGYSVVRMKDDDLTDLFHDIDVSIDFLDKKRHNEFRQHPKAWEWAIESLEKCQRLGIEHSIVTCVTSLTKDEDIRGLLEVARKHDACLRLNWFRPTGRGDEKLCITALRYWQVIRLLAEQADFEGLSDPLLQSVIQEKQEYEPCGCGWTSARIQDDLSVTPCVFLKGKEWSAGSILDKSLEGIRKDNKFKKIRNRLPKKCQECRYKSCHGGCYSRAVLQNGSEDEVDAFCPFLSKQIESLIDDIKQKIVIRESDKVHHGYLCTLITKPKEK